MAGSSIQPPCLLGQHDRDAAADRVGELGGARDQLLLLRIVFERSLGQRADENFQKLRIDAARRALGRVAHDELQGQWRSPPNSPRVNRFGAVATPLPPYHEAHPPRSATYPVRTP